MTTMLRHRPVLRSEHLDDPEVQLMLRVQRDEPGAFCELARRLGPRIFGRFYRVLQDRQEAEDLTQEVFLRLYRNRRRYRPSARFATWLFHITQNVTRNALRRRRRHAWLRLGALLRDEEESFARANERRPVAAPSDSLERSERAALVRAAVAGLADRQRAALEMHQFQDRSCAEIAQELALSPEATKSLLYRARLQLREPLSKLCDATLS